ncbi:MAG: TerB family tellurite resistance protein [Polaromonas sp.]
MRSYPRNSPQAATRILALAMLADAHQCASEAALLERLAVHEQLGLSRHELQAVIHTFCEELLAGSQGLCWADISLLDPALLGQLFGEIDDGELQRKLMNLCITLVDADSQLTEGESRVLLAAMRYWGVPVAPYSPA